MVTAQHRVIRDTSAQDVVLDPQPRRRRQRRMIIVSLVAGLAFMTLSGWAIQSWLSSDVVVARDRVRVATVTRGPFVRDVAAQGVVVAANSPTLFSSDAGTVSFSVNAGDIVRKGQVLAVLESPSLKNEHAREQATLDSLEVALQRQAIEVRRQLLQNQQAGDLSRVEVQAAERELQRVESAWRDGALAERDVARARDAFATAQLTHQHAIENARLQEESLKFELSAKQLERDRQRLLNQNLARRVEELTIRSPVDGMVGNLAVNQKTAVGPNTALLTVVDLSAFEVEFRVQESYAGELALGMSSVINYAGKTYEGLVSAVSPEIKQSEVLGRVRFSGAAPTGLRQNQRVNVRIILDSREDTMKVERGSFVDAGSVAYVVRGNLAERRTIELGAMSVGEVEILQGVSPGDQIVISNLDDFANAQVVRLGD